MNIKFQLVNITTEEYAEIEECFPVEETEDISMRLIKNLKLNIENKMIGMFTKYQFLNKEHLFLIFEIGCHFKIHEKDWEEMIDPENNSLTIKKELLTHFLMLTVGTSRGVLHAKKPQQLYKLILPPINVSKEFENDIVISLTDIEE